MFDLGAPQVITHPAAFLTQAQNTPIGEANKFILWLGVDLSNFKAFLINGSFVGEGKQICAVFDSDSFFTRTVLGLFLNTKFGFDTVLIVDLIHAHKGIVCAAFCHSRSDHDLFHQFQFKSADGIELINQVVGIGMSCTIA